MSWYVFQDKLNYLYFQHAYNIQHHQYWFQAKMKEIERLYQVINNQYKNTLVVSPKYKEWANHIKYMLESKHHHNKWSRPWIVHLYGGTEMIVCKSMETPWKIHWPAQVQSLFMCRQLLTDELPSISIALLSYLH